MKFRFLLLSGLISFVIQEKLNAQVTTSLHFDSPTYFGGKGKPLTDLLIGFSFERIFTGNKKFSFDGGIGFMGRLLPNEYHGELVMQKHDYGAFNAGLPQTITVGYYYRQAHLGVQFSADLKYYFNTYNKKGFYSSFGFGFDNLSFVSHINKYDDYNYDIDNQTYPEAPSNMPDNLTDSTRRFTAGRLNVRAACGYSFLLNDYFMYFVECGANYSWKSDRSNDSVDYIYARKYMFGIATGIKFTLPEE